MSDERLDLSKAARLMHAARAAATGPAGEMPIGDVYADFRGQARAALPAALREEFDGLFPSAPSDTPVGVERLSVLADYLEGLVRQATEDAEDAARAESEGYPLGRADDEDDPSPR
jgi:hypothetical protein